MKQVLKYAWYIFLLLLMGYLIWRFGFLLVWILIAFVISFIGRPLVIFFDKVHFRKWYLPHTVSTLLSLLFIVICFLGLIGIFVPLIVKQAETISQIDINRLAENFQGPLHWIDQKFHTFGVVPANETIQDFIINKAKSLVNVGSITSVLGGFFNVAGNIFVGIFSVLFITFFFLKDENMFEESLLLLIPEKNHEATKNIIADSKRLLIRYINGVLLEVLGVMLLISVGLWIFGVKNALLIGFFGGIMNIIPYIGPIIGSAIGIILGITATLATGVYTELMPMILKLTGVFFVVNFIDNNILVPLIYSSSVKAHPLEVFIVIIIGGSLAGILGMLLAIPMYTILRVIGREFFQQFRVVQKLTEKIE